MQAKQGFGLVEGHASVEDLVEEADGFAEVFPEHKFMIVKILQVNGGWRKGVVGCFVELIRCCYTGGAKQGLNSCNFCIESAFAAPLVSSVVAASLPLPVS